MAHGTFDRTYLKMHVDTLFPINNLFNALGSAPERIEPGVSGINLSSP